MSEIQKANKRFRTVVFIGYAVGIVLFIAILRLAVPLFLAVFRALPSVEADYFLQLIALLFLLLFISPTIWILRLGFKIRKYDQYPLPNSDVMSDRVILRGKDAQKTGRRFIILAIISLSAIILSILATDRIYKNFHENPFRWISKSAWKQLDDVDSTIEDRNSRK